MLAEIEIRQDVVDCNGKRRTGFVEVYVDVTNNYEWHSIDADAFQYFREFGQKFDSWATGARPIDSQTDELNRSTANVCSERFNSLNRWQTNLTDCILQFVKEAYASMVDG
jgi:hypothetical protein